MLLEAWRCALKASISVLYSVRAATRSQWREQRRGKTSFWINCASHPPRLANHIPFCYLTPHLNLTYHVSIKRKENLSSFPFIVPPLPRYLILWDCGCGMFPERSWFDLVQLRVDSGDVVAGDVQQWFSKWALGEGFRSV